MARLGQDQAGVLAADADGQWAVQVDGGDDLPVDLADQDHPRDVHRLGVGDAMAVHELRDHAEALHERADLRATAMHHDRAQAHRAHQHHVLRERRGQGRIHHGVAAELHHDGAVAEALDVRQGLDEHGRPLLGRRARGGAHEVPMFSSTYAWVRSLVRMRALPSPKPRWAVTSIRSRAMYASMAAGSTSTVTPCSATRMSP